MTDTPWPTSPRRASPAPPLTCSAPQGAGRPVGSAAASTSCRSWYQASSSQPGRPPAGPATGSPSAAIVTCRPAWGCGERGISAVRTPDTTTPLPGAGLLPHPLRAGRGSHLPALRCGDPPGCTFSVMPEERKERDQTRCAPRAVPPSHGSGDNPGAPSPPPAPWGCTRKPRPAPPHNTTAGPPSRLTPRGQGLGPGPPAPRSHRCLRTGPLGTEPHRTEPGSPAGSPRTFLRGPGSPRLRPARCPRPILIRIFPAPAVPPPAAAAPFKASHDARLASAASNGRPRRPEGREERANGRGREGARGPPRLAVTRPAVGHVGG